MHQEIAANDPQNRILAVVQKNYVHKSLPKYYLVRYNSVAYTCKQLKKMKYITYLTLSVAFLIISCSPKEQTANTTEPEEVVLGKLQHGFTLNQATQEKFEEDRTEVRLRLHFLFDGIHILIDKKNGNHLLSGMMSVSSGNIGNLLIENRTWNAI